MPPAWNDHRLQEQEDVNTLVNKDPSGIVVAPNRPVTPELEEVLKIIARENLVLATGPVHAEEVLAVTKRRRSSG